MPDYLLDCITFAGVFILIIALMMFIAWLGMKMYGILDWMLGGVMEACNKEGHLYKEIEVNVYWTGDQYYKQIFLLCSRCREGENTINMFKAMKILIEKNTESLARHVR